MSSAVEEMALRKLKEIDNKRWLLLRQKRCHCVGERIYSLFTSRPQPKDLQYYDKFSV
jgi:hypothetical protein